MGYGGKMKLQRWGRIGPMNQKTDGYQWAQLEDGYWTPWHLANEKIEKLERDIKRMKNDAKPVVDFFAQNGRWVWYDTRESYFEVPAFKFTEERYLNFAATFWPERTNDDT